ncbi:hypothetical protein [Piscinibacter sp.]|jgi:predicted secreted protein|uniref:hypothetical protein n=1 Tax=Piscinibacter sp. TaxID=1903157 RepID=UPI003559B0CD
MKLVRCALALGLMCLLIEGATAVGPLAGLALGYLKQRVVGEAQSRMANAMMSSMMGGMPGMGMGMGMGMGRAGMPAASGAMPQGFAEGPPPTKEEAQQLVSEATALGMLKPEEATQMVEMLASDAAPPQMRASMYAMFKQGLGALSDFQQQLSSLSPEERKSLVAELAKEIGARPNVEQGKMLDEIDRAANIFPRGMADEVRKSLRTSAP